MKKEGFAISEKPLSIDKQLDLAEKNLNTLLEWVGRHDYKSSIIFGIGTGMLGVLSTFAPYKNSWSSEMIVFGIGSAIPIFLTLLCVYLSNYPRLDGPIDSLFYFGSISKKCLNQYQNKFSNRTKEEHLADILEQCHQNSKILNKKFNYLKLAYIFLFISVIPWLIAIYLFKTG